MLAEFLSVSLHLTVPLSPLEGKVEEITGFYAHSRKFQKSQTRVMKLDYICVTEDFSVKVGKLLISGGVR